MTEKYIPIDPNSKLGELVKKFEGMQMVEPNFPSLDYATIYKQVATEMPEIEPIFPEGYFEKTQEYQQKSLEILESINKNTANLYSIVELIKDSNEKQDEMIALVSEILALAKAKDKKEADSLYKKITSKISTEVKNVDAIIKLVGWATSVYQMISPYLQQ